MQTSSLGDVYTCELHVLESCAINSLEQRSCQTTDCVALCATTVEGDCREVYDWSPIRNLRHIDIASNLNRSNLCQHTVLSPSRELLHISLVGDDKLALRCCSYTRNVDELAELLNNANLYRLALAVKLNNHRLALGRSDYDVVETVLACRNCNVDWSSLCAECQALTESYGYGVRSVSVCCQLASLAVNVEVTCDWLLSSDNDVRQCLLALDSETKNTCEVVELQWLLCLALCCSCCVAIHWSCACCESTLGVHLSSQEGYRVQALSCSCALSWCRVNCVEWTNNLAVEGERCRSLAVEALRQWL